MANPKFDIGHGVTVELRYHAGVLHGVWYEHPRPDGAGRCSGFASVKPAWDDGWDVVSLEPLTLSPSLLCRACGHHGFVQNGAWAPA